MLLVENDYYHSIAINWQQRLILKLTSTCIIELNTNANETYRSKRLRKDKIVHWKNIRDYCDLKAKKILDSGN